MEIYGPEIMKTIANFKCTVLSLAFLSFSAHAQMVVQAYSVTLQPQISRDEIGFSACGVRANVLDTKIDFAEIHDFSLAIRYDLFAGLLKSGKFRVTTADMQKGNLPKKAVIPAPVKFWLAMENEGKAIIPQKIMPADTAGFILETADLAETYSAILAIIHGERVQFATRYKNDSLDTVIAFGEKMPEQELKPLMACLVSVSKRLEENFK
jgi:hypothetical protein